MNFAKTLKILVMSLLGYLAVMTQSQAVDAKCLPSFSVQKGPAQVFQVNQRGSFFCNIYLKANDEIVVRIRRINAGNAYYFVRLYHIETSTMVRRGQVSSNNTTGYSLAMNVPDSGHYHLVWEYWAGAGRTYNATALVPQRQSPNATKLDLQQNNLSTLSQFGFQMTQNLLQKRVQVLAANKTRSAGSPFQNSRNVAVGGERQSGLAAGDQDPTYNGWMEVDYADFGGSSNNPDFEGHQLALAAGIDHRYSPRLTIGAALTVESGRLETVSNIGTDLTSSRTGIGIAPYAVYQVNNLLAVTTQGNLTYGDNEVTSQGQELTQDNLRWSLGIRADLRKRWGNFGLLAGLGVDYMQENILDTNGSQTITNGNEDSSESGSFRLNLQPSYLFALSGNSSLEPYFLSEYRHGYLQAEQSQSTGNIISLTDDQDLRLGLGLRYQYSPLIQASFEGSHLFWQDDYAETRLNARLAMFF